MLQRQERNKFYHLPVYCGFCGQLVVRSDDNAPVSKPCPHTLFIAHDEGFEYLDKRSAEQLTAKGFEVINEEGGIIEINHDSDDEPDSPEEITDLLEFSDGVKIAAYVGAPSFFGTYVGFAPTDDE